MLLKVSIEFLLGEKTFACELIERVGEGFESTKGGRQLVSKYVSEGTQGVQVRGKVFTSILLILHICTGLNSTML